jgi:hypothetical protein
MSGRVRALHTALLLLQSRGYMLFFSRAVLLETSVGYGLEGRAGAHTSNVGSIKGRMCEGRRFGGGRRVTRTS